MDINDIEMATKLYKFHIGHSRSYCGSLSFFLKPVALLLSCKGLAMATSALWVQLDIVCQCSQISIRFGCSNFQIGTQGWLTSALNFSVFL